MGDTIHKHVLGLLVAMCLACPVIAAQTVALFDASDIDDDEYEVVQGETTITWKLRDASETLIAEGNDTRVRISSSLPGGPGLITSPGEYSISFADSTPGRDCWVIANRVGTRTAPHELGHCRGLSHRNKDYNALMCQTGIAEDHHYSDNQSRFLRQKEWDTVRIDSTGH